MSDETVDITFILNTRPLLNLLGTGAIEHIRALYGSRVYVPPAVAREISEYIRHEEKQVAPRGKGNPRTRDPDRIEHLSMLQRWSTVSARPVTVVERFSPAEARLADQIGRMVPLDPGESETLAVAQSRGFVVVIDERAAHNYAEQKRLRRESTLSIMVNAIRSGRITRSTLDPIWSSIVRWWPKSPGGTLESYVGGRPVW